MSIDHAFSIADYAVFAFIIVVSIAVGIYSAFSSGGQKTTHEFLVANKKLRVLPVTLSMIVSYESAIMMLGFPAEMYTYGVGFWWTTVSWSIVMMIAAFVMVPTFYDLKIVSAYEYLESRFESRLIRLIGAFLGCMINVWYMGIVLFGPATALEAVTGFEVWNSIILISAAAVIYTTIGGLKAVVWTDAFQAVVMTGGMLAVIIQGTLKVGSLRDVFLISKKGNRLEFFNFDPDPTVRITFWGVTIGTIIRTSGVVANQTSIQRIAAMPSKEKARLITALSAPGFVFFGVLALLEGLVAYAYFITVECDPLEAKIIRDPNQIIPYFVMELFSTLPGLPGLFLAALFSASLSTLSSGYASIAAIVWSDFIKPQRKSLSEKHSTIITKFLVVLAGLISICIAILVMKVGGPMTQIAVTLISTFSGPLAGLFLLGGLFPIANSKGALAGVVAGMFISLWKAVGSMLHANKTPYLSGGSTSNCTDHYGSNITRSILLSSSLDLRYGDTYRNVTSTIHNVNTTLISSSSDPVLAPFYSVSYLWIGAMAIGTTIIVGLMVSLVTAPYNLPSHDRNISPYLFHSVDRICCCLPDRVLMLFRYKQPLLENEKDEKYPLELPDFVVSRNCIPSGAFDQQVELMPLKQYISDPNMNS